MANLEINTQLFDGLSLHQRIWAVIEIETAITKARESRISSKVISIDETANGTFVSRYVMEDTLKKLRQHLIVSTVEKFGGVG